MWVECWVGPMNAMRNAVAVGDSLIRPNSDRREFPPRPRILQNRLDGIPPAAYPWHLPPLRRSVLGGVVDR